MFQNDEKLEKGYHEIYEMMLDILYQKTMHSLTEPVI